MELGDSHNPDDPMFARLRESTLQQYGVSRVEDLPFNYGGLVMAKGEESTTNAYRERMDGLRKVYRRQERMVEWAGALSPYVATRLLSMALAGADVSHQLEFERQAEDYRYRLIQSLNDLHQTKVAQVRDQYETVVNGAPTRMRIDAANFHDLPTFDYAVPDARWALTAQRGALVAGAAGLTAMLTALAWAAARMHL
jgi:ABC-2 type transport system permease protein